MSESDSKLSNKDTLYINRAIAAAKLHVSGGSYNMVAIWVKGSKFHMGYNVLFRQANQQSSIYPEICGFHAELDLHRRIGDRMRGGTLYVAGAKQCNGATMQTTKPCIYCTELLAATKTNWVVYLQDRVMIKSRISEL